MCTSFTIDISDLLDILITNQKLDAQTTSKVNSVIHMTQIRQKTELVRDKIDASCTLFAAECFFDCQIKHQAVNGSQHRTNAQIILNKNAAPTFCTYKLTERKRSFLFEVSDEHLPHGLLHL